MSSGPVALGFVPVKFLPANNFGKGAGQGSGEESGFDRLVGHGAEKGEDRPSKSDPIADKAPVLRTVAARADAFDHSIEPFPKDSGTADRPDVGLLESNDQDVSSTSSKGNTETGNAPALTQQDEPDVEKFEHAVRQSVEDIDLEPGEKIASATGQEPRLGASENSIKGEPASSNPTRKIGELMERYSVEPGSVDRHIDADGINADKRAILTDTENGRFPAANQAPSPFQSLRRISTAPDNARSEAGAVDNKGVDLRDRTNDAKRAIGSTASSAADGSTTDENDHRSIRFENTAGAERREPVARSAHGDDRAEIQRLRQTVAAAPANERPVGGEQLAPVHKTVGFSPAASSLLSVIENNTNWSDKLKSTATALGTTQNSGSKVGQSLRIQLHPQELGMVEATLRISGNKISLVLNVDQDSTLHSLMRDNQAIHNALRMSGLQVDEVTIGTMSQDNDASGSGERTFQNGGAASEKSKEHEHRRQGSFRDGENPTDKESADDPYAPAGGSLYI